MFLCLHWRRCSQCFQLCRPLILSPRLRPLDTAATHTRTQNSQLQKHLPAVHPIQLVTALKMQRFGKRYCQYDMNKTFAKENSDHQKCCSTDVIRLQHLQGLFRIKGNKNQLQIFADRHGLVQTQKGRKSPKKTTLTLRSHWSVMASKIDSEESEASRVLRFLRYLF